MPRSKTVDAETVRQEATAGVRRMMAALRTPKGRKNLRKFADQCFAMGYLCEQLLDAKKRRQVERAMLADPATIWGDDRTQPMSTSDLRILTQIINNAAARLSGESSDLTRSADDIGRWMIREGTRKVRPRKFKTQFAQAFEMREHARMAGKRVTQEALAERFTPDAYTRNPESATRAMANALKRIERDRVRVETALRSKH